MNTYEFWNDMDKIYDAIVAYQEKTIEFNKQFINPWVKLGNVFDKNESNEEIIAHKNAIEIDPKNAQNWYELANIYTRFGYFDKSIQAYQKTIELGFESGELYKNLALAYSMTAKHQDAVPVFQKALDMLKNNKEKSVVWNHLGNVYRKLDNYEMALQSFQQADLFEAGKSPNVDEPSVAAVQKEFTGKPTEEIMAAEEASASQLTGEPATVTENGHAPEESTLAEEDDTAINDSGLDKPVAEQQEIENVPAMLTVSEIELLAANNDQTEEEDDESENEMPVVIEVDFSSGAIGDETDVEPSHKETAAETMVASEEDDEPISIEAFGKESEADEETAEVEPVAEIMMASEEDDEPISMEAFEEESDTDEETAEVEPVAEIMMASEEDDEPISMEAFEEESEADEETAEVEPVAEIMMASEEDDEPISMEAFEEELEPDEASLVHKPYTELQAKLDENELPVSSADINDTDEEVETLQESNAIPALSAYEEYLEDNDPVGVNLIESASDATQTTTMISADVAVTNSEVNMEVSTDLTIEMDSKNAHVWNELGNVYFNAGSYDDAIAAYSKAIELDAQFAWPYTNLALSYVNKGRLADAISLYQRGIELFSNEKDKAVAWNRLGNVYRRMNDYENAIAAYQRADELDPGNTAVTQQSRFSLFGSEKVDQEAEYSV